MIGETYGHYQIANRIGRGSANMREGGPTRTRGTILMQYTLGLMLVLGVSSVFGADCDRACLKGLLDQYLNAIVQHNPAMVPLTPGYRQT